MNKRNSLLTAVIIIVMLCVYALPFCAFADEVITVNGESVKKGDVVTFEYYMGGIAEPLEAAGAYIEYDPSCLEYIDDSIGFDVFSSAMYNIEAGSIYYSAIDVVKGFDLTNEQLIVRLSFNVLDSARGSMQITNSFDEIFTTTNEADDLTENDYNYRTVTQISSEFKGNDAPNRGINAANIDELVQSSETDFDNMMLGTDKDELIASNAASVTSSSERASSVSLESGQETTSVQTSSSVSSETAETSSEEEEKPNSKAAVAVIAVVFVLFVAGAVVFSILSKKKSDN